jgi:hypothetical protein
MQAQVDFNHIIPYYSPISSSGGKRKNKSRKHKTYKNKRSKRSKTRRTRNN